MGPRLGCRHGEPSRRLIGASVAAGASERGFRDAGRGTSDPNEVGPPAAPSAAAAALVGGLGAALVAADVAILRFKPLLLTDPDPAWAVPRLILGLLVIAAAAAVAGVMAGGLVIFGRTAAGRRPLSVFAHGPWLIGLAALGLVAAAILRFTHLSTIPLALWGEDLTLIDPALALSGRWTDFGNSIRPAPFGVSKPYGSVGVLYLEAFRWTLLAFGRGAFGLRCLSALAGTLSVITATALGRSLLPRGGGTLAGLAVAGMRWSLILSRWGYVAILLAPIADVATLVLLRALRRHSSLLALAAGAVLGIGAHVYLSSWVVLGALLLFVVWPAEGRPAPARRAALALALAVGFALVAAPLFLLREGRVAPYFARARDQSLLREMRNARSPLPALDAAALALEAPWWAADPSPWQDVPRPRLGWLLGIPVAAAFARALLFPARELSGFLLAHSAAACAAAVASGTVMQPNGFRFAYLTTVTGVAVAAGLLAIVAAVPRSAVRPAALAACGALVVSGALAARSVFCEWAPRLEVLDGFSGRDNLLARTALIWEPVGTVRVDPRLPHSAVTLDLVSRVRRADLPPPPTPSAASARRIFRIAPAGERPRPGERLVGRVFDERGTLWAVVLGIRAVAERREAGSADGSARRGACEIFRSDLELRGADLREPIAVPDPHAAQRRAIEVDGHGPRALRNQPVENGRAGVAQIAGGPDAGIDELGSERRRGEAFLEERAREDGHPAEDAAMVVDGSDLAAFPRDQHHFPVFPEQDPVADIPRRIEPHPVQVPLGLASDALDETSGRGALRGAVGVDENLPDTVGEGHREIVIKGPPAFRMLSSAPL
jgi:hypothetical protein